MLALATDQTPQAALARVGVDAPQAALRGTETRRPLGRILLEMQAISPDNLLKALALRKRQEVRLGDILLAHGWVREADLMAALAEQWHAAVIDPLNDLPDPRLIDRIGAETCLKSGMLPWRRVAGCTVIATSRPEDFARLRDTLPEALAPYAMVIASEPSVHAALLARRQTALIRRAETLVAARESCRNINRPLAHKIAWAALIGAAAAFWLAPIASFALVTFWAVLTLAAGSALKLAAFLAELLSNWRERRVAAVPPPSIARLPVVSLLVPLFREHDISGRLLARLARLSYPRELLDVLLVVEEEDAATRAVLARIRLPHWARVIVVPDGPIRTKPRALNFALNFCRGTIIGVYDAEDAPDPDQIFAVVRRFHERGPEVACLQGVLDYYNPRTNWLSRCFTAEYAAWFRAMLPGLARLGLVVPLGGTTLFFRRAALEALGGWDAHNVTEDADLGIRLARHGYHTELIATVTHEEANCRTLPWVRQRSRWLKGYAMTWGVHMRDPLLLWHQLGAWRFIGFQVLFLGTLSQYLLAPVLWVLAVVAIGAGHPLHGLVGDRGLGLLTGLFIASEVITMGVAAWAVRGREHRHLWPWLPVLNLYFPLGALAAWKAIYEVAVRPFYWDKTAHGFFDQPASTPPAAAAHA
ncbi:MAG: glycosyltransferase [Phaeovulum sp.]|uniref:glycosyltransferase n=1 Tax=Phaeovulum sp. TaxID=2934796 RepID=UPI002730AA4E|nr:glycosyltransferase [Phaeovulum sp.]MDP2063351.1 glycosyltransferase [Phaeovulum sp.]